MTKLRCTVVFEYEANPAHYPNPNPADMADFDQMGYEDEVVVLLDCMSNSQIRLKVEPINDND